MQTWAKRGFQTALVTGGLLMLGTGIASADENVNPDTPAGPLDLNASIPVDISQNAVGTLGKQVNLPDVHKEISTKPVTDKLNRALAPVSKTGALKPASPALSATNGVTTKVTGAASQVGQSLSHAGGGQRTDQVTRPSVESTGDPVMGNKVVGNVALPIQITGNAVGVLGDAAVQSDSTQVYEHNSDVSTSGERGGLAGNAVNLDWALPVQISGNALGLVGSGRTSGSATQSAATTGDTTTDGTNGAVAGNVVSPQGATPVQVSGNALGWFLGHAETDFDSTSEATSGGYVDTAGSHGAGTGNVAALPIALPVKASNNAVSWGGDADAAGSAASAAAAGDTKAGPHGDQYIQTQGEEAFLGGNVVQPQGAVPATVVGNAAAWIGNSVAGSDVQRAGNIISTDAQAGGTTSTTGQNGAGSGNIVDAPVALPVEAFCVGGTWIGNAHATGCDNEVDTAAGGNTYTNGNGSFLGGNSVHPQPAGTVEAFGVGGSWIGNASGSATEDKTVTAGGYNGSLGNDSTGAGNVVQVPVAVPAEVFGVGGSWIGQGTGAAEETKDVTAGGGGNTQDDHGAGSANLIAAPVSLPAQVFGIGGAWIGQGHGAATTDTTSQAGGDLKANGKEGFLAGNIGDVPVSLPTQVHGLGAAWIGNGFGASENLTDSTAGGDSHSTGEGGSLAGNLVRVPVGSAASVFGLGAVWGGVASGEAVNDVVSTAGGDSATNGDGGSIAGNVVSADALPVAQVFGDAASLVGVARGTGLNNTEATSGGDSTTSGVDGALSGDIFDVPVAAVAQVFGVAASLGGVAHAVADNTTVGTVSGDTETAGHHKALSGLDKQVPLGVVAQIFDISPGLLAVADSDTRNVTDVLVADREASVIDLPARTSELSATSLPKLPDLRSLPAQRSARTDLTDIATNMSLLPKNGALPSVDAVPGAEAVTAVLPKLPLAPGADALAGQHVLPENVGGVLPQAQLPALPNLDASPASLVDKLTGGEGLRLPFQH